MPTLKVFVNEATHLFGADLDGNSDPYCVVKIGEGNQFSGIEKTRTIKNTKNPNWKECFTLNVNNPLNEFLFIEVWNKESNNKDNSLGYAQLPLNDLARGTEKQVWIQLEGGTQATNIIGQIASHLGKKKGEKTNHGKVFLGITALDFGIDPQQQFAQQGMQQPGMGGQQGMQQPGMGGQQGMQQPGMGGQQGMQQPGMGGQQGMQQPGMVGQQSGLSSQQGMQQPGMVGQQGLSSQQQPGMHGQSGQSGLSQQGMQQPGMAGQSGGQAGSYGQQSGLSGQQPSVYPPSSGGVQGSHQVNTPQMPSTTMPSSTQPPIDPSQQQKQQSAYPQNL